MDTQDQEIPIGVEMEPQRVAIRQSSSGSVSYDPQKGTGSSDDSAAGGAVLLHDATSNGSNGHNVGGDLPSMQQFNSSARHTMKGIDMFKGETLMCCLCFCIMS